MELPSAVEAGRQDLGFTSRSGCPSHHGRRVVTKWNWSCHILATLRSVWISVEEALSQVHYRSLFLCALFTGLIFTLSIGKTRSSITAMCWAVRRTHCDVMCPLQKGLELALWCL